MKLKTVFSARYEAFGQELSRTCRRHHVTHQQLRQAAHLHSNVITSIKKGRT